jgi:hypothetical protein
MVSWKGRTINQITSSIQRNNKINTVLPNQNLFRALPLKIYRREIVVNKPNTACKYSRSSSSIDELNYPGGSILTNKTVETITGQQNIIESPAVGNMNDTYRCSKTGAANSYNCAENNARRRCRSSGMIKRVYDPARSEIRYFTNTNQYLVSRSKSFSQNQYRHVRNNDPSIVTDPLQSTEVYSPNGISHCPKAHIAEGENVFYYYWVDASGAADFASTAKRTTVTIPPGYYDINDLNAVLESFMYNKKHFFIYSNTHSFAYLMKFVYNNTHNCVELQTFSTASVPASSGYYIPLDATWTRPAIDVVPVYSIPATGFQNIIGFSAGFYPNVAANPYANRTANGSSYGALSNLPNKIFPSYSVVHYKPSNNRFATQGGVSSGDMTARLKYETITRNAKQFSNYFGSNVGNAMAYGVKDRVYTVKDKIGFPVNKTPVIDKYTGDVKCMEYSRLVGKCSASPSS